MSRSFFLPDPVGAPTIRVGVEFPDRIDPHAERERRRLHAARMRDFAFRPLPIPLPLLQPIHSVQADIVDPHKLRERRRMHASYQKDHVQNVLPQPIRILQPNHPVRTDIVDPSGFRTRRRIIVALQRDFTQNVLPQPIRILQPIHPVMMDRVVRRMYVGNFDECFVTDPRPVATFTYQDLAEYPANVANFPKPYARLYDESFVMDPNPIPDATFTFQDLSKYPDAFPRPYARLYDDSVVNATQPERSVPLFEAEYPDSVRRLQSQQQQFPGINVQPERTISAVDAFYPNRVLRPATLQLIASYLGSVFPERTSVAFDAIFPTKIVRPSAQQQQFPGIDIQPERTVPYFDVLYPNRIGRVAPVPYAHAFEPKLDGGVTALDTLYPVRVLRQWPQRDTFSVLPTMPERSQVAFDAVMPSRVVRPAALQSIWTAFDASPERKQVAFDAFYPARITRSTALQFIASSFDPRPERTIVSFDASYPSRVVRPTPLQVREWNSIPLQSRVPVVGVTDNIHRFPDRARPLFPRSFIVFDCWQSKVVEVQFPNRPQYNVERLPHFAGIIVAPPPTFFQNIDSQLIRSTRFNIERLPQFPGIIVTPPPFIYTYYDKGGGDDADQADSDYFSSFNHEFAGAEVAQIAWELGFDSYSKEVKFSEFAMKVQGVAHDEMQRTLAAIDKNRKGRQVQIVKAVAIGGVVYFVLRYVLFL